VSLEILKNRLSEYVRRAAPVTTLQMLLEELAQGHADR
jgi:hypothetical protein